MATPIISIITIIKTAMHPRNTCRQDPAGHCSSDSWWVAGRMVWEAQLAAAHLLRDGGGKCPAK
jgi:hypothetical protein